jgi:hypothetical protein
VGEEEEEEEEEAMAKSMRSKKEKRLRAIRREMVEPYYDNKDVAKLAAQEAALAAPKLPARPTSTNTDITTTSNAMGNLSLSFSMQIIQFLEFNDSPGIQYFPIVDGAVSSSL